MAEEKKEEVKKTTSTTKKPTTAKKEEKKIPFEQWIRMNSFKEREIFVLKRLYSNDSKTLSEWEETKL